MFEKLIVHTIVTFCGGPQESLYLSRQARNLQSVDVQYFQRTGKQMNTLEPFLFLDCALYPSCLFFLWKYYNTPKLWFLESDFLTREKRYSSELSFPQRGAEFKTLLQLTDPKASTLTL